MPSRVYSERLLHGNTPDDPQSLTVPAGKRAVVRCLTVVTYATVVSYFWLQVAGVPVVWLQEVPAWTTRVFDLRCVAYAGETIAMDTDSGSCSWHVSGFMFNDT